jgi:hypothetical protein
VCEGCEGRDGVAAGEEEVEGVIAHGLSRSLDNQYWARIFGTVALSGLSNICA